MSAPTATAGLRSYRRLLKLYGQTSPPVLSLAALRHIRGRSVCDVGCGSGLYGFLLRSSWHFTGSWGEGVDAPERLVALDFSPVALERAARHGAYDEYLLASSARLPLPDRSVDTALSVESLEHLFPCEVEAALRELLRVARRRIVITTPAPEVVVNVFWLRTELEEAKRDPVPLGREEFLVLGGCVHKSTLFPEQLCAAGFRVDVDPSGRPMRYADSHVYSADVDDVKLERLGAVDGVEAPGYEADDSGGDWAAAYVGLLESSLAMRPWILSASADWRSRRLG